MADLKYSKQSKIFGLVIFLFLAIGMFCGIKGISKIVNYREPYKFIIILSFTGLLIGNLTAPFLKPILKLNSKQLKDFFITRMFISVGTIGILIFLGNIVNTHFSKVESCDNWIVIKKEYKPYRYMSPSVSSLFVEINDKKERIICKHEYWNKIYINDKIKICTYKSKLGFDYFDLPFE